MSSYDEQSNSYLCAGPGARLTLDTIPRKIAEHRPKPYQGKPAKEETIKVTAKDMKAKIRRRLKSGSEIGHYVL